jgi:hypothetical protein
MDSEAYDRSEANELGSDDEEGELFRSDGEEFAGRRLIVACRMRNEARDLLFSELAYSLPCTF